MQKFFLEISSARQFFLEKFYVSQKIFLNFFLKFFITKQQKLLKRKKCWEINQRPPYSRP